MNVTNIDKQESTVDVIVVVRIFHVKIKNSFYIFTFKNGVKKQLHAIQLNCKSLAVVSVGNLDARTHTRTQAHTLQLLSLLAERPRRA